MRLMTLAGPNAMAKAQSVSRMLCVRSVVPLLLCLAIAITFTALSPSASQARTYTAMIIDGEIMTLYMVFDALERGKVSLSTRMKVSKRAWGQAPSKLGLQPGETISVKDAILALVTKSANDIAVVVAEHLGGTEIKFAQMMTSEARRLGMSRTTFRNASGLPNRGQMTTARDMIKLAVALRKTTAATIITLPPKNSGLAIAHMATTTIFWRPITVLTGSRPAISTRLALTLLHLLIATENA